MRLQKKIAYVLLGVGIGLVLVGFTNLNNPIEVVKYKEYTDEEILNKANEIKLSKIMEDKNFNKEEDINGTEQIKSDNKTISEDETSNGSDGINSEDNSEEKADKYEDETNQDEDINVKKNIIIFEIKSGEVSETIVNRLYDLEIIEDKDEFIKLVEDMKLEKKFQIGTYEIVRSMDKETLIKLLTSING